MRSISLSPCGNFLASGDEEGNVVVWCTKTTKILRKYKFENKIVDCVEWNPNRNLCILAVANEENIILL